jgi:deoxycytidylate deaminase
MYKTQYKSRSPYESWNTLGMYTSESNAISSAMLKKKRGALIVRVTNKSGHVVYTN